MVIDKRIFAVDALILFCTFILFGNDFEIVFVLSYIVFNAIRIVYKLFVKNSKKIEYILLSFRVLMLIYFYFRGYLGVHIVYNFLYHMNLIFIALTILESLFYIYKTFENMKQITKVIVSEQVNSDEKSDFSEPINIANNTIYELSQEPETFSMRRSEKLNTEPKDQLNKSFNYHGIKVWKPTKSDFKKIRNRKSNSSNDFFENLDIQYNRDHDNSFKYDDEIEDWFK